MAIRRGTTVQEDRTRHCILSLSSWFHQSKIIQNLADNSLCTYQLHIYYILTTLKTTKQLADVIATTVKDTLSTDSLGRGSHIATRTFQAIRIFVNNEYVCFSCYSILQLYININKILFTYVKTQRAA